MSKIKIPSIYCIIALLYFFTAPMLKATQVYKETNNHDDAFSDLSDSENEESKGTAYEEPERILPTLDSIQNHIQQFQKDGNQKKQGALLIGRSGAGKTSLINLLAGKPLRSEEDDIEGYVLANTSPEQPQIGDNVKSETSSPNTLGNLWDLPGFFDNTGSTKEVINSLFIESVFKSMEACKIVLVIEQKDFMGVKQTKSLNLSIYSPKSSITQQVSNTTSASLLAR